MDSSLCLALGIVSLYARGIQLFASGIWHRIVIGQGWTVICIWHLASYHYTPGVDSSLCLVLGIVSLYARGIQLFVYGTWHRIVIGQ